MTAAPRYAPIHLTDRVVTGRVVADVPKGDDAYKILFRTVGRVFQGRRRFVDIRSIDRVLVAVQMRGSKRPVYYATDAKKAFVKEGDA